LRNLSLYLLLAPPIYLTTSPFRTNQPITVQILHLLITHTIVPVPIILRLIILLHPLPHPPQLLPQTLQFLRIPTPRLSNPIDLPMQLLQTPQHLHQTLHNRTFGDPHRTLDGFRHSGLGIRTRPRCISRYSTAGASIGGVTMSGMLVVLRIEPNVSIPVSFRMWYCIWRPSGVMNMALSRDLRNRRQWYMGISWLVEAALVNDDAAGHNVYDCAMSVHLRWWWVMIPVQMLRRTCLRIRRLIGKTLGRLQGIPLGHLSVIIRVGFGAVRVGAAWILRCSAFHVVREEMVQRIASGSFSHSGSVYRLGMFASLLCVAGVLKQSVRE
ncbi:hypothetical protein K505DRAFT_386533, partial [Melanomma pulvis-pyrius CBS 109.77]